MKGIEHVRNKHASSGPSTKPKTEVDKIENLKAITRSMGPDPEKIVVENAETEMDRGSNPFLQFSLDRKKMRSVTTG